MFPEEVFFSASRTSGITGPASLRLIRPLPAPGSRWGNRQGIRRVSARPSNRKVDRESLALSTNPQFLKIIKNARKEIRAGKTTSLEALEKKIGGVVPRSVK